MKTEPQTKKYRRRVSDERVKKVKNALMIWIYYQF